MVMSDDHSPKLMVFLDFSMCSGSVKVVFNINRSYRLSSKGCAIVRETVSALTHSFGDYIKLDSNYSTRLHSSYFPAISLADELGVEEFRRVTHDPGNSLINY